MATENVVIKFRADGTRVVQRDIKKIGTSSQKAAASANFLKRALAFVGVAAAVRGLTRTLAKFEQTMSTVKAITQATETQFKQLRDRAKELGATTRFSASQAGEGLVELSRAGFQVAEAIGAVDDTLRLAQAGNLDLATAAKITAGAIRGFRVEVDQAGRFTDVLALTANSSATDVTELGEAMKFVAPAAASLKVPFETASAALGVLADNQLRGTLGGTGLRKVLSTLAKGGKPLQQALKASGQTLADVDVETVGLASALKALEKASIDTGDAFTIFGDRGQPAFDILVNNIPKIEEFDTKLQGAAGTAQRIADVMDDNLNGALLAAKSAFEAVILAIGELGATSVLTRFFRDLADGLRFAATNARQFGEFALGASLIPALFATVAAVKALTIAVATNPIGVLLVGLSAGIGLLVAFRDEIIVSGDGITTLADIAIPAFEEIKKALAAVANTVLSLFPLASNEIDKTFNPSQIEEFIRLAAQAFDALNGIAAGIAAAGFLVFDNFSQSVRLVFEKTVNIVITIINAMLLEFTAGINNIRAELEQASRLIPGIAANFDALDILQLDKVDIGPQAAALGKSLDEAMAQGINNSSAATDAIDRIFAAGKSAAKQRGTAEGFAAAASAQEQFRTGAPAPAAGVPGAGDASSGGSTAGAAAQTLVVEQETNGVLEARTSIMAQLNADETERVTNTTALNQLLAENKITQEQFNELAAELPTNIEASATAMDGFAESIKRVDTSAKALGASIGAALTQAVGQASAALAEFAVNGLRDTDSLKEAFSSLLKSLAKQIIQVIIQTLILKAIQASLGGAPTGAQAGGAVGGINTTDFSNVAQAGGQVGGLRRFQAGGSPGSREPVLVGEQGPEIFVPTRRGNIIPNSQMESQPVNVQVVNVRDPNEIPEALDSPESQEKIINIIRNNRRAID